MEHVSYALFDDADRARTALDEIKLAGNETRCAVVLHKDHLDDGMLTLSETGAGAGAREGAVLAGVLGAIAGVFVAGPIGLLSGGALGAVYGLTFGAIAGASGPDRNLSKLSRSLADGKLLLVVEAPSIACHEKADAILRSNGGTVKHKPLFS